jgi:vancomycin resistance protein YoaR
MLVGFFGTLALCLALLAGLSVGIGLSHEGAILPGVRVAGVDLGSLDRAAAAERLRAQLPSLSSGEATIVVDGSAVTASYADLGRDYDLDVMLDAAYGHGRSGNPLADGLDRLRAAFHGSSVALAVHAYDPVALDRLATDVAARFSTPALDASAAVDDTGGFRLTTGRTGTSLEADAVRAALADALASTDPADLTVELATTPVTPDVTTAMASAALGDAARMTAAPLGLVVGDTQLSLDPATLREMVAFGAYVDDPYAAGIDLEAVRAALSALAEQVSTAPQDASFTFDASGVSGVVPGVDGRELNLEVSSEVVRLALVARAGGATRPTATLAFTAAPPALTTAAAEAAAPQMRMLGSWTTYYVPGEGNGWNANIHIGAWDLDGHVVAPGEWFEFWQDIGPVSLERGYTYGGAIIGGRSVPNGALAGGICSTSTTLFNAAMRSGLEIGERTNHSYYIKRYPVGLDATVLQTDTWETDMTFRNDMATPVVIRSYTGNGWVRFDIWGVPDGRTVTLSAPVTSNHGVARETTVRNNSLPPGTAIRLEYPHNGFDAVVTRWVRDANGEIIWENTWVSHYRTVNGITEVGPPKPKPDDPPNED